MFLNFLKNKHMWLLIVISLLGAFILFPITIWILKLLIFIGNLLPELGNTIWIKTNGYIFDLNDYFNFFTVFLQIIVTSIFSYFIWKSSQRSNKLSEEIKEKEENRDKEFIRENALIVYYDLSLGLKNLLKLYNSRILNEEDAKPKKLYFSDNWIKNVAVLKDKLQNEEINSIYTLYEDLHTIKDFLNNKKEDHSNLDNSIKNLYCKVFIFDESVINFNDKPLYKYNVQSMLKSSYQCIFEKIKIATHKNNKLNNKKNNKNILEYNDGTIWYEGDWFNSTFEGIGKSYNSSGDLRYDGIFDKGIFKKGKRYEYYKNENLFYELEYENYLIKKGTVYDKNNNIVSEGNYKNNKIWSGKGKTFDKNGDKNKEGIWEKGELVEGIIYDVLIEDSKGFNFMEEDIYDHLYESEDYDLSRLAGSTDEWMKFANIKVKNGNQKDIIEESIERYPSIDNEPIR